MDKELWEGLVDHIKKNGEESIQLSTIIFCSIEVPAGDYEVELTLRGMYNGFGFTKWDDRISVKDVSKDAIIGRLYEDNFTSLSHTYGYAYTDLEDIIHTMALDYQDYMHKREQEELNRRSQEELREEKAQNFLYGK